MRWSRASCKGEKGGGLKGLGELCQNRTRCGVGVGEAIWALAFCSMVVQRLAIGVFSLVSIGLYYPEFFHELFLAICFLRGVPEDVVGEIGEIGEIGEAGKRGWN